MKSPYSIAMVTLIMIGSLGCASEVEQEAPPTPEMMAVFDFAIGAQPPGDVLFATAWTILPASDMGRAFMKSCHQAKVIHEKYGAKVRLWQPMSGRYAGKFLYQLACQHFSSLGEAMDGWKTEFAEVNCRVPVSATIDSQIVMRGSTLLCTLMS